MSSRPLHIRSTVLASALMASPMPPTGTVVAAAAPSGPFSSTMPGLADDGAGHPRTLLDALRQHAARAPDALFCRFVRGDEERDLSFGDLVAQAERFARLLHSHDVGPGDLVLIVAPHDPALLHAFIGSMLAGAIPAFLPPPTDKQDPEFFWHTLREMTADLSIAAWIIGTDDGAVERFARHGAQGIPVLRPEDAYGLAPGPLAWHAPEPQCTAFLQFSSGTTGIRKGVMLSHAQVLEQVRQLGATLRLEREDRIVSWLPLYHDMGLIACFVMPWVTGVPVVWMSPFEWVRQPWRLFELIQRHGGTLTWMPNFAFRHLCATVDRQRHYDLARVRAFINCSEACKVDTFEEFADAFAHCGVTPAQLQTCYAMAETVFAVTHTPLGETVRSEAFTIATLAERQFVQPGAGPGAVRYLSVGRPLPGFKLVIADARGEPCPEGCLGEVTIQGACLSTGYYRNVEATRAMFRNGWYATGDIGFIHDGELYIAGRSKEVIIVHGRNYFAHDLEAIANGVHGVHRGRVVAIGVSSALSASEEVILLVENDDPDAGGRRTLTRAIKEAVSTRLGVAPLVRFVAPRWLVKTTSGKIDRQSNKRKFIEQGGMHGQPAERRDPAHA